MRARDATNTKSDSAGSPDFDPDGIAVAVHSFGVPAYGHPKYNPADLINKLRDRLVKAGRGFPPVGN